MEVAGCTCGRQAMTVLALCLQEYMFSFSYNEHGKVTLEVGNNAASPFKVNCHCQQACARMCALQ